jgi:hypothetical protein
VRREAARLTIDVSPIRMAFMDPKEELPKPKTGADDPEEKPKKQLSAEEQMEQYEEALKETDWGHQPC